MSDGKAVFSLEGDASSLKKAGDEAVSTVKKVADETVKANAKAQASGGAAGVGAPGTIGGGAPVADAVSKASDQTKKLASGFDQAADSAGKISPQLQKATSILSSLSGASGLGPIPGIIIRISSLLGPVGLAISAAGAAAALFGTHLWNASENAKKLKEELEASKEEAVKLGVSVQKLQDDAAGKSDEYTAKMREFVEAEGKRFDTEWSNAVKLRDEQIKASNGVLDKKRIANEEFEATTDRLTREHVENLDRHRQQIESNRRSVEADNQASANKKETDDYRRALDDRKALDNQAAVESKTGVARVEEEKAQAIAKINEKRAADLNPQDQAEFDAQIAATERLYRRRRELAQIEETTKRQAALKAMEQDLADLQRIHKERMALEFEIQQKRVENFRELNGLAQDSLGDLEFREFRTREY